MLCREQWKFFLQLIPELQIHLAALRNVQLERHHTVAVRCDRYLIQRTLLHAQTIHSYFIQDVCIVAYIIKIHVVMQYKSAGLLIIRYNTHRTVHILIFKQSCMWCTIRVHQSIHTEISIMDCLAVIAAIIIFRLSIFRLSVRNRMIAPLPDESATHPRIFLDYLEIILQIAGAVSHAMTIFYKQKWLAAVLLQILFDLGKCRIHPAV